MPVTTIKVIEGVFTAEQKASMIQKVTEAEIEVEGEAMCGVCQHASRSTGVHVQDLSRGATHMLERAGDPGRRLRIIAPRCRQ